MTHVEFIKEYPEFAHLPEFIIGEGGLEVRLMDAKYPDLQAYIKFLEARIRHNRIELCFWDPARNRPAQGIPDKSEPSGYRAYTGCPNEATICAGSREVWHLCEGCAGLPKFKRFKKRSMGRG